MTIKPETPEFFDKLLDASYEAAQTNSAIYKPTIFWQNACEQLVDQMRGGMVDRFRSLSGPLGYFVPTYGAPGSGCSKDQFESIERSVSSVSLPPKVTMTLQRSVDGNAAAEADYRVLTASGAIQNWPVTKPFVESEVGTPIEQFTFEGARYSRSSLNYSLGLAYLTSLVGRTWADRPIVLEIGGGFGTLGELLGHHVPEAKYIDLDIPPTGPVAAYYLSRVFGSDLVTSELTLLAAMVANDCELQIDSLRPYSVLNSHRIEQLSGEIDLFVNFISFQEMEPEVVQNYLQHVRRLRPRWVLLRNLREGKPRTSERPGVGVDTPILGDDYVQMMAPYRLLGRDGLTFGHRTADGFHSELLVFERT